MPDPYPTDFSDVSAADPITASRNNAITKKLGLTAINTDDPDNPTGHLSIPTLAGTPAGTPANGEGSMVWNSLADSLHVNTAGSTWAEIGGGGGATAFDGSAPAATNIATITVNDSDPALEIVQSGAGDGLAVGDGVAGVGPLTHDTRTSINPAGLTFINKGIAGNITVLKTFQYGTAQLKFTGANGGYQFTDSWTGVTNFSIGNKANPSMLMSNAGKTWSNVNNPGDDTRITWGNTNGNTGFIIGASAATYEASIFLYDGGTAKPSYVALCDDAGTANYLFFDTSGYLRKTTTVPVANDQGTVIG